MEFWEHRTKFSFKIVVQSQEGKTLELIVFRGGRILTTKHFLKLVEQVIYIRNSINVSSVFGEGKKQVISSHPFQYYRSIIGMKI